MNEKNFFGLEKIINKGGGGGWNKERGEEVRNKCAGGRLLEPLEYKLREEKVANCEKLYCCGRKSCESSEIFLATFRNFFFPQQFLSIKLPLCWLDSKKCSDQPFFH